jgi:hypothetical protein
MALQFDDHEDITLEEHCMGSFTHRCIELGIKIGIHTPNYFELGDPVTQRWSGSISCKSKSDPTALLFYTSFFISIFLQKRQGIEVWSQI